MSALRLLVLSLNVLAGVLVLAIAVVAAFVSSEAGAVRAVAYVAERVPAELRVAEIDGTLAGGLVLRGLSLRAGGDVVTVDAAALSFSASSLVAGAAVLNRVELDNVVYVFGGADPSAAGPAALDVFDARGAAAAAGEGAGTPDAPAVAGAAAPDTSGGADAAVPNATLPIVVRSAAARSVTLRSRGGDFAFRAPSLSGRWVGRSIVVDDLRAEAGGIALLGAGRVVAGRDGAATLALDPLALDTDRGTLTGRGGIALATTAWDLTLDTEPKTLFPPRDDPGRSGRRFEGRLLPVLEWTATPLETGARIVD